MENMISPPWFRGKASQTSLAGHAITISTPLGSGSKHLPLCTSFCSSTFCSINYNFKNTIYMKKITASVVIDAFVHITSIDIQVLEKRPYDMYNLFPHGSVTNTDDVIWCYFGPHNLFFVCFFSSSSNGWKQKDTGKKYLSVIYLHFISDRERTCPILNTLFLFISLLGHCSPLPVLLWWFYHCFHLSWYWPVWNGSYFLPVVPLYCQLKNWALIMLLFG